MKKSGFTLMELLVYIAIMGIVVVVAGQAFSDSTKMRVRTESMLKANQQAENVATIFKDDVSQMGAKSSKEINVPSDNDRFSSVYSNVYINPLDPADEAKDSSSFVLTKDAEGNTDLKFRRVRYDNAGKYEAIEVVHWYQEGTVLKRSCWVMNVRAGLTLNSNDPCSGASEDEAVSVTIAENVSSFSVKAGKPLVKDDEVQMFPRSGHNFMLVPRFGENYYNFMNVLNSGDKAKLSGFASNFDMSTNSAVEVSSADQIERNQIFAFEYESGATIISSSWKSYCAQEGNFFTFEPQSTYEIYFEMPTPLNTDKMSMFKPEQDFWSVGFRNAEGNRPSLIDDFSFYPPVNMSSAAKKRSMRFTVADTVKNVCLAFTFASFSPVTSLGTLTFEKVKVNKLATVNYTFNEDWNTESNTNVKEKKNVKAFEFELGISSRGEQGHVKQTVLVPSNGPRD